MFFINDSYDGVQAAWFLTQQVQCVRVNLREGFGSEAVDPRAVIHSGAPLQPLRISFLLCCSCHALWDVATGLNSTFSCCIYGNTGFTISLSHCNHEQMDSSKRPIILNRCYHIVKQILMEQDALQPKLHYNVILYLAGFIFKGHCGIFRSLLSYASFVCVSLCVIMGPSHYFSCKINGLDMALIRHVTCSF